MSIFQMQFLFGFPDITFVELECVFNSLEPLGIFSFMPLFLSSVFSYHTLAFFILISRRRGFLLKRPQRFLLISEYIHSTVNNTRSILQTREFEPLRANEDTHAMMTHSQSQHTAV